MQHDRIVPASEYDELIKAKELADKMPCVQIYIYNDNYKPQVNFIGDSTTIEILRKNNNNEREEYHKIINDINVLINKFYKDNFIEPHQETVNNLTETNKLLVTKLSETKSDLSTARALKNDFKNRIRILSENNQSLVNENLNLKKLVSDNRTWFQKIFW
jgi:hypothetical protein